MRLDWIGVDLDFVTSVVVGNAHDNQGMDTDAWRSVKGQCSGVERRKAIKTHLN